MTETLTNRHGDEIAVGQLWTDDPRRTTVRTLRIDDLVREGNLGPRACALSSAPTTPRPGRSLPPGEGGVDQGRQPAHHRSGRGYRLEAGHPPALGM